jgi:hypothetical protein
VSRNNEIVPVKRSTLLRLLRHSRAPYAEAIESYDGQVTIMFDSTRKIENGLASLLGQKPKLGK